MLTDFLGNVLNPFDDSEIKVAASGHFPNGASLQQLKHLGQLVHNGFGYYDYGKAKNRKQYGQEKPPQIDISEIQEVPVAMFVGHKDTLANVEDNRWVKDQLGTLVYYEEIQASHASFVLGKDMSYFDRVVELAIYYNKPHDESEELPPQFPDN
jgi:hypothetical protein